MAPGKVIALAVSVVVLLASSALAREPSLTLEHGLVSARFDTTPASEVVDVVRRATGMRIQLPASASSTRVTLTVDRIPLEQFLRRLVDRLDLGGFALVYEPDGTPTHVVAADKGREASLPAAPPAQRTRPEAPQRAGKGATVPFLIATREAQSMKLGAPGQVLVVQSPSMSTARTGECAGTEGAYPVQTVLVTDGSNTYVTSIVVCRAEDLKPGETLGLVPGPAPEAGSMSRFMATTQ